MFSFVQKRARKKRTWPRNEPKKKRPENRHWNKRKKVYFLICNATVDVVFVEEADRKEQERKRLEEEKQKALEQKKLGKLWDMDK